MSQLTGNSTLFSFKIEGDGYPLRVLEFKGVEKVSAPFQYFLELADEDESIPLNSMLGKTAVLTLQNENGNTERQVNGIITDFQYSRQHGRFSIYRAELAPRLALLDLRRDIRIFQAKSTTEIIQDVFKSAGILADQFNFKLRETYEPREYCVQYRETDLNFVARLMEEEGIFYFFEHDDDEHVMILTDHEAALKKIESPDIIPFNPGGGLVNEGDTIQDISLSEHVQTGRVVLHDFNFRKPTLDLQSKKESGEFPDLEVYDAPGHYMAPNVGGKFAKVRLESTQATSKVASAKTDCMRMVSGYRFTLSKHPRDGLNQEFFITGLECEGKQPQALEELAGGTGTTFQNRVTCIPANTPYRAPCVACRPRVEGVQTAIVTGPPGEEIYVDEFGRVKVHFHWDRENEKNEKSSCWIRVSQTMAGQAWGSVSIPRIGHEVIVNFIEGNPDRPIILGQVYHGTNRPPYKLPDEKTKSTIKSNSSKGGGGFNEFRFEDKKGEEQLFFHAERNQDTRVKNDTFEWIGNERHLIVKADQLEQVDGDMHLTVKGDNNVKVSGTVSLNAEMDLQQKVGMNHAVDAGMEIHLKSGMNVVIEAGMSITLKAGGGFIVVGPAGVTISGTPVLVNSGGSAGSGSGCSPDAPKSPKEAAKAKFGSVTEAQPKSSPAAPPSGGFKNPQAQTLAQAAKGGTPFCEKCEAARRAQAQQGGA